MTRAQHVVRILPIALALTAVAAVWLAGAVWSFDEQTRYAASRGFSVPWLLPLVLDGLAVSLAGVAYAAALDGRAAVQARTMTALAVAASATSNGAWAWTRTSGDPGAVALAVGVPVAANLAFEVLLSELRRQVHRRRGQQVAIPIPLPRLARIAMAPLPALREWRALVLDATAPAGPRMHAAAVAATAITTSVRAVETAPVPEPRPARRQVNRAVTAGLQEAASGDLLSLTGEIARQLEREGKTVTRASLTAGIRARGRSVSNERAGQLLAQLRKPAGLPGTSTDSQTTTREEF